MLHYFNISKLGKMFFHLGRPTQCLSSCSSVHWSFRKLPFKSLREKKNLQTDLVGQAVVGNMKSFNSLQHLTCVQVSWRQKSLCLEQEINHTGCQYLTVDCIVSLEISFNFFFFFNLYSRIVFTFEALGGKVSSRQKILKAFEFMFFPCRSH